MPAARRLAVAVLVTLVAALPALSGPATAQTVGADVSVAKEDSPDPVTVDTDLTYTITVRNDGPLVAPEVVVSDALVLTVDFVSATSTHGSCSETALLVTCNLGNLANGVTATVTLVVRPNAQGSLVNAVSAAPTPSSLDPDSTDNVAVESTTVVGPGGGPGADVAISKADAPDPVAPGATLNYTVTVQNLGSEAATGVQVTDVLPTTGATFVSASASQGSCGAPTASLTLTCDIGGLANGASATVQIAVQPTTAGSLLNTATVVSTSLDPNADNNASAASTTVDPNAGTPGGPGGQGLAACTIMGTPLADVLVGTAGNDVICGLDGNDRMTGLDGKDTLIGGKDDDQGNGGKGPDLLKGESGKDRLQGAAKKDRLSGGGGKDRLAGGPGKDRLNGGAGNDRCQRGRGDKLTKCP